MPTYRFVVRFNCHDPRSAGLLADARTLGFTNLVSIHCQELYFIKGQLSQEELQQLALRLLTDPVTQAADFIVEPATRSAPRPVRGQIEVVLRPGVTDPVAEQIARAAHQLGFAGVERASTGFRYLVEGTGVDELQLTRLARRLLANPVVHHWAIGEVAPSFPQTAVSSGEVSILPVRKLNDNSLLALSAERRAALDLAEMKALREYYRLEGREPTDIEFEMIAQTWSEHCVHKTFKALVTIDGGRQTETAHCSPVTINSILKTYLRSATQEINAPWVRSAFVDNAGIVDFDDECEVSFKVETHNHPSAIEPFGGANTGTGGVIRDVLGVSATPIAATDVLCFGPQDLNPETLAEGILHPRRIFSGVVAGVQDYGNKIGLPTVSGAILFDEGYTANPLVFCGCVGLAPRGSHVRSPQPGDRIIVIGGRTGRDGLRGATFSSMTMDAQTGEVSGASVQIGNPVVEKGLIDVIVRAREKGLYNAITDCGAGGLSSAVGEMASGIGGEVELQHVPLKYPGLAPWEIWLSEAQERMVLAVSPEKLPDLCALCEIFGVNLTDIGFFQATGRLRVRYGDKVALDLENHFLHEGTPQRRLKAKIVKSKKASPSRSEVDAKVETINPAETLLRLLSHPNIASKESVIRVYDHEIQGGTAVKPLVGVKADAPSDAVVIKPLGTKGLRGIVLSCGINPEYGKADAWRMACAVVDEAVRNAIAVGADPERIALLDNFCWGDPLRPEVLGSLVEAARGCHEAALRYRTPFISGKDSLNNEYLGVDGQRHAIPPTLLISAMGIIEDVSKAVTMDLKEAGNKLYLLGAFQPVFGGSHFSLVTAYRFDEHIPDVDERTPEVYMAFHRAQIAGLIRSAHDLSEGGLAVALAEMCIGGRLGAVVDLPGKEGIRQLFGETTGCLLAEVKPEDSPAFEKVFQNLPYSCLGEVNSDSILGIQSGLRSLMQLPVSDLVVAWKKTI